jgi:gluconolactonase
MQMLVGAGAVTTVTVTGTAFGGWEPSERYPDPAIQILDPSFARYRLALASVERIATNMRWCEGPVYFGDARCLLWSDIPNNRIMRWDEETGAGKRVPQAIEQRKSRPAIPISHCL